MNHSMIRLAIAASIAFQPMAAMAEPEPSDDSPVDGAIVVPAAPVVADSLIDLSDRAEEARTANRVPALAIACIRDGQVIGAGVSGVRKDGALERVTLDDQWHIGSCTKAMTATLAGILVEKGALRWETTIGQTFPEFADQMNPSYKAATLANLLSHRSGLPADNNPTFEQGVLWSAMKFGDGDLATLRMTGVKFGLQQKPVAAPGEKFAYSNLGYTIAGVMLERAAGDTYENLMQKEIFTPLGITSAGWGPPGTPDAVTEPFGHDRTNGSWTPVPTDSSAADNPNAIAPAGTLHLSIIDWAKFIAAHAREGRGDLLASPRIFKVLHTPVGDSYAMGWVVTARPWAPGPILTHNGSNSHWFAAVWVAPEKQCAYLAVCNAADMAAMTACDQAITSLIVSPPGPQAPAPGN